MVSRPRPAGETSAMFPKVALIPIAALLSGHAALAVEPEAPPAAAITNSATLGPLSPIVMPVYHANDSLDVRTYTIPVSNIGPAGTADVLNISQVTLAGLPNSGRLLTDSYMTGSVTGLAAGATSNALTLNSRDAPIGGVFAMNIWLTATSGTVQTTGIGVGTVAVSSTVIPFAQPALMLNGTRVVAVDLGGVRQGSTATATLGVTNAAANVAQADLLVMDKVSVTGTAVTATGLGFGKVGGGTASGALAPGQTAAAAISLALDTSISGVRSGTIAAGFLSDGTPSGNGVAVMRPDSARVVSANAPPMPIPVTGTVYAPAQPVTNTTSLSLAARVGDPGPTGLILFSNKATGPYAEWLTASIGASPAGTKSSGGGSVAPPGPGTAAAGLISLPTTTGADFSGTVRIDYSSMLPPEANSTAPIVSAGTGTVALTAHVFERALATVQGVVANGGSGPAAQAGTLDFGIVHAGDVVMRSVNIANAAHKAGLNDSVWGAVTSISNGFTAAVPALSKAGVAAGEQSSEMALVLDTSKAGVVNGGTVALALFGRNPDLADVHLGNAALTLNGTVNNHATLALANPELGHLDPSPGGYTLKLGRLVEGKGAVQIVLDILNTAIGAADTLNVNSLSGPNALGPTTVIGGGSLAPGRVAARGLRFALPSLSLGDFSYDYQLLAYESNASGYFAALASGPLTLTVEGTVVAPEPWAITAMATGLVGLLGARMRRRRPGD